MHPAGRFRRQARPHRRERRARHSSGVRYTAHRTTLSVYFAHGESHLHTANYMNLHRNTVKYRINKALADPVTTGRDKLDLALALQVCELLGRSVLRPSD